MQTRFLIVVAFVFLSTIDSLACSCAPGFPGQCNLPDSPVAFVGTVISKEFVDLRQPSPPTAVPNDSGRVRPDDAVPPPDNSYIAVTFQVNESLRGDLQRTIVVRTEPENNSCNYPFEVGHEYLVFAGDRGGALYTGPCYGTSPVQQEAALIQQLRFARAGQKMADLFGFVAQPRTDYSIAGTRAIAGVSAVTVIAKSDTSEFQTESASDGTYQFMSLPPGRYKVSVQAPRNRIVHESILRPVGAGSACRVDVQTSYDGTISGIVVGPDGPLSGSISTFQGEDPAQSLATSATEVQNGQFKFAQVAPGRYRLRFTPSVNGRTQSREFYYYPGTMVLTEAGEIALEEGEHLDGVKITVP